MGEKPTGVGGYAFRRILFDLEYEVALRLKPVIIASGKTQRVWFRDMCLEAIKLHEGKSSAKKK